MTTAVKIYREAENESLIFNEEDLTAYNELALELGLQTQEKAEEEKCPNVYICLNTQMQKQLYTLCPVKEDVLKYKRTTIPLEVLRVYKFAKDNEMFEGFCIWYNDTKPDPLLIGWNYQSDEDREKKYTWRANRFLIARWGDCSMELEELLESGFAAMKQELLDKTEEAIQKCKAILEKPDVYVRKILSGFTEQVDVNITASHTIY